MALQITLSQTGKPVTPAGQARENLALGVAIVATASGGNGTFAWLLADKPPADDMQTQSSASLSSSSGTSVSWTPDNDGTYRIECTSGTETVSITAHAGATLATTSGDLPQREPAFGETVEHNVPDVLDTSGNRNGWERAVRRWMKVIKKTRSLLANYLPLAGGTMSGAISMGTKAITNLADALQLTDAVNLRTARGEISTAITNFASTVTTEIANAVANYLPLVGGTMSGAINMGSNKVTNAAAGTSSNDYVILSQLTSTLLSTIPLVSGLAAIQALTMSTGPNFIIDAARGILWAKYAPGTFPLDSNDTVVQTTDNSAQYVIAVANVYSPKWRARSTWSISTSGTNWGDGSSGSPVASLNEIDRRIGGKLTQNVTVTYGSGHWGVEQITLQNTGVANLLTVLGTETQLTSATVTTYTDRSTGTNKWALLKASGVDWRLYIGKRIDFATTPATHSWVLVASPQGEGNDTAEVTIPIADATAANSYFPVPLSSVAAGVAFTVNDITAIDRLTQSVDSASVSQNVGTTFTYRPSILTRTIYASELMIDGPDLGRGGYILDACKANAFYSRSGGAGTAKIQDVLAIVASSCLFDLAAPTLPTGGYTACGFISTSGNTLIECFDSTQFTDSIFDGLAPYIGFSSMVVLSRCGAFRCNGVGSYERGVVDIFGYLLGQGNAVGVILVHKESRLILDANLASGALPTMSITGTSGDWCRGLPGIGSVEYYSWSDAPRRFNAGEATVTLPGGSPNSVAVPFTHLPSDAVVHVSRKTDGGIIGSFNWTQTTSGITVTAPNNPNDTSTFTVSWSSRSMGDGGVYQS